MRTVSNIYSKLVKSENDVIGHVAYSLYKIDKGTWIENKHKEGTTKPTEKEIQDYADSISSSQTALNGYKVRAQNILTNYTALAIQEYEEEKKNEVIGKLGKNIHGFWYGVGQSLVAAIIFAILSCILVLMVKFGGYSLKLVPTSESKSEIQNSDQSVGQSQDKEPTFELKAE